MSKFLSLTQFLLVDDHPMFRESLLRSLKYIFKGISFTEAANGKEAIELCKRMTFDIVMLDITMPVMNGLDCLKEIKTHFPVTKVIMLSQHDDVVHIKQAKANGADAYLFKTCHAKEFRYAIDAVIYGEKVYPNLDTYNFEKYTFPKTDDV